MKGSDAVPQGIFLYLLPKCKQNISISCFPVKSASDQSTKGENLANILMTCCLVSGASSLEISVCR